MIYPTVGQKYTIDEPNTDLYQMWINRKDQLMMFYDCVDCPTMTMAQRGHSHIDRNGYRVLCQSIRVAMQMKAVAMGQSTNTDS